MNKTFVDQHDENDRLILPRILHRYGGADFVTANKARFVFYFCLLSIVSTVCIICYSSFLQVSNPFSKIFNYPVMLIEFSALLIFMAILLLLVKGFFAVASNMLIVTALAAVWLVMLKSGTPAVSNLDTIVYVFAILAMTPILVKHKSWALLFYALINVPILWVYMYTRNDTLRLSSMQFYDYLADVSIALMATSIIVWNTFIINRGALNRLERDIGRREKAEIALGKSREDMASLLRFQNEMLDTAIIWIETTDVNGNVLTWNRAAERISGYSKEEVIGNKKIWEWLYPDESYRGMIYGKTREIVDKGERIENFETRIRRKDGAERIISWYSNYIYGENGNIAGSIGLGADITERRREQEEKEKLEEQMLQMQKMESIGRLAGGIAHDFNNLLTAILGTAELGLISGDRDFDNRAGFTAIKNAAESASNLTRQLLLFSRKQVLEPKVFELNELISHVADMLVRMIGENINLNIIPAGNLCMIMADPGQLEQILINLAVNARDAMPDGGTITLQTARVSFDSEYCAHHAGVEPGDYVMLSVSDTGHGIKKEIREHIFEPFYTTKKAGRGTGLGLATVYGAVRQSGGFITFDSEEGHGAVFKVYFPRALDRDAPGPGAHETGEFTTGNETILLVEDNEYVLDFAVKILTRMGYRVLSSTSGEDALKLSEEFNERIDLMMTDVILTGINGRALAKKMSAMRPDMKVLYTSGYTGELVSMKGAVDEGIHFIGKPYSAFALSQMIRRVLEGD